MKKGLLFFVTLVTLFSLVCMGFAYAGSFNLTGTVQNSSYAVVQNANVSVYQVAMNPGAPPTETLVLSNYTNSTGGFVITNLNDSFLVNYKIKINYRNSTNGGNVTEINPTLPPMPGGVITLAMNGGIFYLIPAVTVTMYTSNLTDIFNGSFNSLVFDNALGMPVAENVQNNNTNISTVYLPRDRNYTLMFMRDPTYFGFGANAATPPLTYSLNYGDIIGNGTAGIGYSVSVNKSLAYTQNRIWGYVYISGNMTGVNNVSHLLPKLSPLGMVPPNSEVLFGTNNLTAAIPAQVILNGNISIAFFNYSVMGSGSGIEYMIEVYANGTDEYFAAFQNVSITGDTKINITLRRLGGRLANTTVQGTTYKTSLTKISLLNGDTPSSAIQDAHVELTQTLPNGYVVRSFIDSLTLPQSGPGYFESPILINSTVYVKVFSSQFAPIEKKLNTSAQAVNVTLKGFDMKKFDSGAGDNPNISSFSNSQIAMSFFRNTAACNNVGFSVSSCRIGSQFDGSFNPMQAMMAGKSNLYISLGANASELMFVGVDMLASGPPDAAMSDNANQQNNSDGDSLEDLWKFGSLAPKIYDAVIIGIPYNTSRLDTNDAVRIRLDYLYDNDWNLTWNSTSDTNATSVPSEYADYNLSWLNRSLGGMRCYTSTGILGAAQYCYINTSSHMLYLKVPHFSNLGTVIAGSIAYSGYANITRPLNISYNNSMPVASFNGSADNMILNVTTSTLATCVYAITNFSTGTFSANVSMTGNKSEFAGTLFNATFNARQGDNTIRVYCNRTETNYSVVDQVFFVDTQAPLVTTVALVNKSLSAREFNWTIYDNGSLSYTCNLTLDGIVNLSNIAATNGTVMSRTISGLNISNHEWNVTCWDGLNNTNISVTSLFNRTVGPVVDISFPTNALHMVQNLSIPLRVAVTEAVTLTYNFDGGQNYTWCTSCTSNRTNMTVTGFGNHSVTVIAVDATGNVNTTVRNFNLTLDSDGNGTADNLSIGGNDDDGDGNINAIDTMMGNATNVATNMNLSMQVNNSLNLMLNYSGNFSINITNGSVPFVTMSYNFINSTPLILGNVTVLMEDSSSLVGRTVVRNLPPRSGTYKTVYVNKKNSTQEWVCVKDSEPGLNHTLSLNCSVSGEVLVPCNGTTTSGMNCTTENGRLKVYGLSYSIAQSMCKENWTISYWSECSSSTQTRTVADTSSCGTIREKPLASQSCTSSTTTTTTTTSTSGGSTTSTTSQDRLSYILGNILAGEESKVTFSNVAIGVTEVAIKAKESAYAVKIVIERLADKPSSVSSAPAGTVYKYLSFANENLPDSAIESAKIKFKVDRAWMDANKAKTGDVALARHDGSSWTDLKTIVVKSDSIDVTFEATTPGFSYFAIRATPTVLTEEEIEAAAQKAAEEGKVAEEAAAGATALEGVEEAGPTPWKRRGIIALIAVVAILAVGSLIYFLKMGREKDGMMKVKLKRS